MKMKKYTILKNWHYSFFLFGRLFGWYCNKKTFYIKFKFSKECWWNPPRNQDDYDLNKLYGLSFGFFIHKDSVRFTWKPKFEKEGVIEIYGYTYDASKKEHTSLYLCDVNVETEYDGLLGISDSKYELNVGTSVIVMNNSSKDNKIQKEVYPYFGGNNRSPQKMNIWVSFLDF